MNTLDFPLNIKRKKSHEFRVGNIIEVLSDPNNEVDFTDKALSCLSQHDFDAVANLRNGIFLCGYILCDEPHEVSYKSIIMNLKEQKIYNIEQRKMFCCDWCFAAFKHLRNQLKAKYIWRDNYLELRHFDYYSLSASGCKGDVVFDEKQLKKANPDKNNKTQRIVDAEQQEIRVNRTQRIIRALDEIIDRKEDYCAQNSSFVSIIDKLQLDDIQSGADCKLFANRGKSTAEQLDTCPEIGAYIDPEETDPLARVVQAMLSWLTEDTKKFIKCRNQSTSVDKNAKYIMDEYNSSIMNSENIDQTAVRTRIIMKRIEHCGKNVLEEFKIPKAYFFMEVNKFLDTCELKSNNILFSTSEIVWLTIIFIHLLYPTFLETDPLPKLMDYAIQQNIPTHLDYCMGIFPLFTTLKLDSYIHVSSQGDNQ